MTKINISIPKPCHEDWQAMTPENKGRFCDSCQKKVFDFTASSDREIINAFEKNQNLCGRFLNSQLDRDLVKPKEKNTIWLATTTALISLIGLNEANAQQKAPTEQTDNRALGKFMVMPAKENILVSGIVYDVNKTPVPHLGIYFRGKKIGETNENGNFSVTVNQQSRITFQNNDEDAYQATDYYIKNGGNTNIEINLAEIDAPRKTMYVTLGGLSGMIVKERTFFGRLLHRIGNLFR